MSAWNAKTTYWKIIKRTSTAFSDDKRRLTKLLAIDSGLGELGCHIGIKSFSIHHS